MFLSVPMLTLALGISAQRPRPCGESRLFATGTQKSFVVTDMYVKSSWLKIRVRSLGLDWARQGRGGLQVVISVDGARKAVVRPDLHDGQSRVGFDIELPIASARKVVVSLEDDAGTRIAYQTLCP